MFKLYSLYWLCLYPVYIMLLYTCCMKTIICVYRALQNSLVYTVCNCCVCIEYLCIRCFCILFPWIVLYVYICIHKTTIKYLVSWKKIKKIVCDPRIENLHFSCEPEVQLALVKSHLKSLQWNVAFKLVLYIPKTR